MFNGSSYQNCPSRCPCVPAVQWCPSCYICCLNRFQIISKCVNDMYVNGLYYVNKLFWLGNEMHQFANSPARLELFGMHNKSQVSIENCILISLYTTSSASTIIWHCHYQRHYHHHYPVSRPLHHRYHRCRLRYQGNYQRNCHRNPHETQKFGQRNHRSSLDARYQERNFRNEVLFLNSVKKKTPQDIYLVIA